MIDPDSLVEVRPGVLGPASRHERPWLKIWYGMGAPGWLRLLWRNRFAVDASRMHVALVATLLSAGNSANGALQSALVCGRRRRGGIAEAPLFVIGHWRCGTTWLHELLGQDDRHTYPTTYECLAPNHFLVTEAAFRRIRRFLGPIRRPMDSMAIGWESPQEDEFALMNMGQPSAYQRFAFPNTDWRGADDLMLDLKGDAGERWKAALRQFLAAVTSRRPGRVILKSPLHMGRIRLLLDMFPDARFVHIIRDPYVVFSSTAHMWTSMWEAHGLQKPALERLDQRVFETFLALHARFEEARALIPPDRFLEVRYEDLVRDPVTVVREIYGRLDLGSVEPVMSRIRTYVESIAGHRVNTYALAAHVQDDITRQWGTIISRQGYPLRPLSC